MDRVGSIKLRQWELRDTDGLEKYANNKRIADNLRDVFPHPYTREDAEQFINGSQNSEPDKRLVFAITHLDEAIGCISISRKEDVHRKSAEIGFWVAEEYWNQSVATMATRQICSLSFKYYDITRIYGILFANNAGAKQVLLKCGFSYEGTLKKSIYKNNNFMDSMIYAIVK